MYRKQKAAFLADSMIAKSQLQFVLHSDKKKCLVVYWKKPHSMYTQALKLK